MPWCPECGAQYRDGFARCSECDVALVATLPVGEEVVPGPEWVEVAGYTTEDEAWLAHGLLEERGILYAPDYVINGGGVINVYGELMGWDHDRAKRKAAQIYDTLLSIFATARSQNIPTFRAADHVAEARIRSVGTIAGIRV